MNDDSDESDSAGSIWIGTATIGILPWKLWLFHMDHWIESHSESVSEHKPGHHTNQSIPCLRSIFIVSCVRVTDFYDSIYSQTSTIPINQCSDVALTEDSEFSLISSFIWSTTILASSCQESGQSRGRQPTVKDIIVIFIQHNIISLKHANIRELSVP